MTGWARMALAKHSRWGLTQEVTTNQISSWMSTLHRVSQESHRAPHLCSSTRCQSSPCLACKEWHRSRLVDQKATIKDKWSNRLSISMVSIIMAQATSSSAVEQKPTCQSSINCRTRGIICRAQDSSVAVRQLPTTNHRQSAKRTKPRSSNNKRGKNWRICIAIWKSNSISWRMRTRDSELGLNKCILTYPKKRKMSKIWNE